LTGRGELMAVQSVVRYCFSCRTCGFAIPAGRHGRPI